MKISVTGSEGFLGKSLINIIGEEYEVIKFDRKKNNLFDPKSLQSFLKDADVVIHLASVNRDNDYNLFKTNFLGTAGLLEGIVKYAPKAKIIFSSSFQVYNSKNAYALSKKLAEEAIVSFSRIYGVKSIIFRISNIYGPGGKQFYNSVIATFAHLVKNKKTFVINGTGDEKRDYIYVDDVAEAVKKAINYNAKSGKFDICSGKLTSLNEIVELVNKISSTQVSVEHKNIQEEKVELHKTYKEAEEKLSWKPRVSLEEGLKNTFAP